MEFNAPEISARQSDGAILIPVVRNLTKKYMKVNWRENTEHEFGNDWRKEAGVLEFDELCGIQNITLGMIKILRKCYEIFTKGYKMLQNFYENVTKRI